MLNSIEEEPVSAADPQLTMGELLRSLQTVAIGDVDTIDTDSDELRFSLRGFWRATKAWHRGRILVVAPGGDVPQWLNHSLNFFLRSMTVEAAAMARGDADVAPFDGDTAAYRNTEEAVSGNRHYTRLHVVDQNAVMPPDSPLGANSFSVEPFLYHLWNASSIFVYMNDDYFILKKRLSITEFINPYGGPVVRLEGAWQTKFDDKGGDPYGLGCLFNAYMVYRELDQITADREELGTPLMRAVSSPHSQQWRLSSLSQQLMMNSTGSTVARSSTSMFTAVVGLTSNSTTMEPNASKRGPSPLSQDAETWLSCVTRQTDLILAAAGTAPTAVSTETTPLPRCKIATMALDTIPVSIQASGVAHFQLDTFPIRAEPSLPSAGTTTAEPAVMTTPTALGGVSQFGQAGRWMSRGIEMAEFHQRSNGGWPDALTTTYNGDAATKTKAANATRATRLYEQLTAFLLNGDPLSLGSETFQNGSSVLQQWAAEAAQRTRVEFAKLKDTPRLRRRWMRGESHAPFVQCRNLWRYFHTRYEAEVAWRAWENRLRDATDIYPPYWHTAILQEKPWAGSPKYLPHLMAKQAWREAAALRQVDGSEGFPVVEVALDNEDGCAPATILAQSKSHSTYQQFTNHDADNNAVMEFFRNPGSFTFSNINSKFTLPEVGRQLRNFLSEVYPASMLLEQNHQPRETADALFIREAIDAEHGASTSSRPVNASLQNIELTFQRLMEAPLVLITNDDEGFCPLLRSLGHALPQYKGRRILHLVVPPSDGLVLEAARQEARHELRHFFPLLRCQVVPSRIQRVVFRQSHALEEIIRDAMELVVAPCIEGVLWESSNASSPLPVLQLKTLRQYASSTGNQSAGLPYTASTSLHRRRVVHGIVIDARTLTSPTASFKDFGDDLSKALAVPGELLALEDFVEMPLGLTQQASADATLSVRTESTSISAVSAAAGVSTRGNRSTGLDAEKDADAVGASVLLLSATSPLHLHTHWVYGASERALLGRYLLPNPELENMGAPVVWDF